MQISFKEIPYFSKLFIDFIDKDKSLDIFFPSNYSENKREIFDLRLNQTNGHRVAFQEIIKDSLNFILTNEQKSYLDLLSNEKTLIIMTGQQPGIFGGPLYSLFKAISTISYAQKYKALYPEYNFVPVYWVEDSDDDVDEVNKYCLIDNNYEIHNYQLDNIKKRKLSHFELNESINLIIENLSNLSNQEDNKLLDFLKNLSTNEKFIADNFINSINYFTKNHGLLFIKSSKVFDKKIYNEIIIEDVMNPGKISSIINLNNEQLIKHHYNIQANNSDINFFFSNDDRRHKIHHTDDTYLINSVNYTPFDLNNLIENSNNQFTPKVLLRPLVQDFIFPTAAYVGGPGEIAYLSQLSKLYEHFNLNMPIIEPRHSITIINKNIERIFEKENLEFKNVMKSYQDIERELSKDLIDSELDNDFDYIEGKLKDLIFDISPKILEIDKSLTSNIDLTMNKSVELINNLRKKVIAQLKKKNEVRFSRIMKCNRYLYPNNNLQERELNIFNLLIGKDVNYVVDQLYQISSQGAECHYFLNSDNNL